MLRMMTPLIMQINTNVECAPHEGRLFILARIGLSTRRAAESSHSSMPSRRYIVTDDCHL